MPAKSRLPLKILPLAVAELARRRRAYWGLAICHDGREAGILDRLKAQNDGGLMMSTTVATQREATLKSEVTPEELLAIPDGGHYELIDGELKERRASVLSNFIASEISATLRNHCREHRSGWVFGAELGHRCFPWQPKKVRRADVSFVSWGRYSWQQLTEDGFMTIPPDLALVVVSRNDVAGELEEKFEDYLRARVRLVWVAYPRLHIVQAHRADGTIGRFRAHDQLSGEDVLPSFRYKVEDLFPTPPEIETYGPTSSAPVSPSPAQ
jgi:Uma2 family endonuclease